MQEAVETVLRRERDPATVAQALLSDVVTLPPAEEA
jgi:hypothetical protein